MHWTVSYKDKPDWQAKRAAVFDLVNWLGFRRSLTVARAIRKGSKWMDINYACGFAGVRGYPVVATYERWAKRKLTDADWKEMDND